MRTEAAGNQRLVRTTNQRAIIRKLRKEEKMSRADLAKQLKLSSPAVSSNITTMLEKRLLIEIGEGGSSGGRKPQMLEFNYKLKYIISVVMSENFVTLTVGDLRPQIICSRNHAISQRCSADELLCKFSAWIEEVMAEINISSADLLCIALITPGIVETKTGKIIRIHPKYHNWGDKPMKLLLEEHFGVKVFVRNDVDAAAVAEHEYGVGEGCNNMVFMDFSPGVGAGIIIDGKLHKGSKNCAGEIGFMTNTLEVLDQPLIEEGYFETHSSIPYVLKNIKARLVIGEKSVLPEHSILPDNKDIDFSDVVDAYFNKDPLCTRLIRQLARQIALAILNINCVLDVEMFILGGKITFLGDDFLSEIKDCLKGICVTIPEVKFSSLGENECIFGGFAVGIDYLFDYICEKY